jgi:hypothetical protein
MSSGAYFSDPKCGYSHIDKLVLDGTRAADGSGAVAPLVSFLCGEAGYCHCGNENKMREAAEDAEKAKRSSTYGEDDLDVS